MTESTPSMAYRRLGRSGLMVSPLCLGTMMFGGRCDAADAAVIIDRARDAGVNFIDTADVYNEGRSEQIVGAAVRGAREHWIVATKAGNAMGPGPNQRGLSRRWLMQAVEHSLLRLGLDWIDIFYLHREDAGAPLEEAVSAIGDLIRGGRIRHFGVSNFRAWRIAEIVRLCGLMGVDRPVVSQPYYNMLNRQPEVEQLPVCGHYGIGVAPYSPLARGVLTAKYQPGAAPPPETRAGAKDTRIMETEWRPESLRIAQRVKSHAEAHGATPVQFALQWALNNRFVTSVIAGPRTLAQWEQYLGAPDYVFTAEDEAFVDALVAPGHPSTPGYTDPQYELEGRPTHSRAD